MASGIYWKLALPELPGLRLHCRIHPDASSSGEFPLIPESEATSDGGSNETRAQKGDP